MPHPLSPTPPEQTSLAVPAGGFRLYFKRISDWIAGLSPAGSTEYDTGPVAIPALTGFTSTATVRRVGKGTGVNGEFLPTAAGTITPSAYLDLGQMPPGFAPPTTMLLPLYANVPAIVQGRILVDGRIQAVLQTGQPTTNINTGTRFSLTYASWTQP